MIPRRRNESVRTLLLWFALCACLAPVQAQERLAAETSIRHATVINVATGAELKDRTLKIQGDRITAIAATQEVDATLPGGVDANGGYLIPGLWDMHVHVHDTNELPLYIANGVTGIRIMSGERDTAALRADLARQTVSPEIYLASAIVDGSPPVWPGSIVVKNAADARRTVGEIKASGADFIKVYSRIPRDAYFALAEEAKQEHIAFEGHVPDAVSTGSFCRRATFHGTSLGNCSGLLRPAGRPRGKTESHRDVSRPAGDRSRGLPHLRSGKVPGFV
jgi:hypothetical protein